MFRKIMSLYVLFSIQKKSEREMNGALKKPESERAEKKYEQNQDFLS